jgi:hypothetical protein
MFYERKIIKKKLFVYDFVCFGPFIRIESKVEHIHEIMKTEKKTTSIENKFDTLLIILNIIKTLKHKYIYA